jgi:uncharacterized protein
MISIHDTPDGTTFAMKILPRARKNAIAGALGDALKLSLTVPPVEGRTNRTCIEFLANPLKVPRSSVTIASGQSARRRAIRMSGVRSFRAALGSPVEFF